MPGAGGRPRHPDARLPRSAERQPRVRDVEVLPHRHPRGRRLELPLPAAQAARRGPRRLRHVLQRQRCGPLPDGQHVRMGLSRGVELVAGLCATLGSTTGMGAYKRGWGVPLRHRVRRPRHVVRAAFHVHEVPRRVHRGSRHRGR